MPSSNRVVWNALGPGSRIGDSFDRLGGRLAPACATPQDAAACRALMPALSVHRGRCLAASVSQRRLASLPGCSRVSLPCARRSAAARPWDTCYVFHDTRVEGCRCCCMGRQLPACRSAEHTAERMRGADIMGAGRIAEMDTHTHTHTGLFGGPATHSSLGALPQYRRCRGARAQRAHHPVVPPLPGAAAPRASRRTVFASLGRPAGMHGYGLSTL